MNIFSIFAATREGRAESRARSRPARRGLRPRAEILGSRALLSQMPIGAASPVPPPAEIGSPVAHATFHADPAVAVGNTPRSHFVGVTTRASDAGGDARAAATCGRDDTGKVEVKDQSSDVSEVVVSPLPDGPGVIRAAATTRSDLGANDSGR
jgi:hypothetical protein